MLLKIDWQSIVFGLLVFSTVTLADNRIIHKRQQKQVENKESYCTYLIPEGKVLEYHKIEVTVDKPETGHFQVLGFTFANPDGVSSTTRLWNDVKSCREINMEAPCFSWYGDKGIDQKVQAPNHFPMQLTLFPDRTFAGGKGIELTDVALTPDLFLIECIGCSNNIKVKATAYVDGAHKIKIPLEVDCTDTKTFHFDRTKIYTANKVAKGAIYDMPLLHPARKDPKYT